MPNEEIHAGWRPVVRSRAHEQVIDAIEEKIVSGSLTVGDPLPPERELASALGVSRAGVREAIRVLEGQGVLRSAVGSGREAGTFIAAMPSAALTRLLRLHVALANFPIDDVVDARVMLERSSADFAARSASPEALASARRHLEAMDVPGIDAETFNDHDTSFHVAIAEAGGNRLVADMTTAIRDALRRPILRAMAEVEDSDGLLAALREQHHAILAAIEAGDGAGAAELSEQHIRDAHRRLPALRIADSSTATWQAGVDGAVTHP